MVLDFLTIIDKTNARGIVDLHRTSNPNVDSLTVTFSSLHEMGHYTLRFSRAACGSAHDASDTILGFSFGATQNDSFFRRTQVTHDPEFENWASVRLFTGGQQVACGATHETFAT